MVKISPELEEKHQLKHQLRSDTKINTGSARYGARAKANNANMNMSIDADGDFAVEYNKPRDFHAGASPVLRNTDDGGQTTQSTQEKLLAEQRE